MAYVSTKTYGHEVGLSCCFRQWKADSHCMLLHGYALSVALTFEADELDKRGWVIDFGGLKTIKEFLQKMFDHTLIIAEDDPDRALFENLHGKVADVRIMPAVGCEAFAEFITGTMREWLIHEKHHPRVRLRSVEVREHGANSAIYEAE